MSHVDAAPDARLTDPLIARSIIHVPAPDAFDLDMAEAALPIRIACGDPR